MGSTVQFGLACFLLFFGLAQFFQWVQHLSLPLPIFILGGAFLAIASNFDKRAGLPFSLLNSLSDPDQETQRTAPTEPSEPVLPQPVQPPRPISFTIRKPEQKPDSVE